jgi:threonine/homoserine/homoserine lactone efflux protein
VSFEFIFVYSVTVFVASILPGPSMLLALTHGMKYGVKKTMASASGNLIVTLLQAAVSIAGLGTILIASEGLFNIIKWAGAAYLVYMGLVIWRSPKSSVSQGSPGVSSAAPSPGKMFLEGALVTAGNPKAIVFFTAVFPQFIDPDVAYLPQFGTLMLAGGFIAFGCFMLYAACGQKIVALFSRAAVGKYVNKVIGGTFIGAGIGLAVSRK